MTDKKTPRGEWIKAKAAMLSPVFNKVNPHFGNPYADLKSVIDATAPSIEKHEFSYEEALTFVGEHWGLLSKAVYVDDTVVTDSFYPLDKNMKDQQKGSGISYARRYNRCSICDVVAEADDDANEAQKASPSKKVEKTISPEEFNTLSALLDDTKSDKAKFCGHFKISSVSELKSSDYQRAVNIANSKKSAK